MTKKYLPKFKKQNPQKLEYCLNDFKKSWREFDEISNILENWSRIVGLELSKECKPLKIDHNILIISVNHPQWRQALIYNKHIIKNNIARRIKINLDEIRIIQSYEERKLQKKEDAYLVWENHPSRIKKSNLVSCEICNCPSPKGEILRWGKCTFCWRKNI